MVNFIEIWDDFSTFEKETICNHLNQSQDDIKYHPGMLGITDVAKIMTVLGSYNYFATYRNWAHGKMIGALIKKGYKVDWYYSIKTDWCNYTIEKAGAQDPSLPPNSSQVD